MISKNKKSFIKRNIKTIMVITVIAGILYFGFPYFTQSGYSPSNFHPLSSDSTVVLPDDITVENGNYVTVEWSLTGGVTWSQKAWGYMIQYKIGRGEYVNAFATPIPFSTSGIVDTITYQKLIDVNKNNVEIVLLVYGDNRLSAQETSYDSVSITVLHPSTTTTDTESTTTTTTNTTTNTDTEVLDDVEISYIIIGVVILAAVGIVILLFRRQGGAYY